MSEASGDRAGGLRDLWRLYFLYTRGKTAD